MAETKKEISKPKSDSKKPADKGNTHDESQEGMQQTETTDPQVVTDPTDTYERGTDNSVQRGNRTAERVDS